MPAALIRRKLIRRKNTNFVDSAMNSKIFIFINGRNEKQLSIWVMKFLVMIDQTKILSHQTAFVLFAGM